MQPIRPHSRTIVASDTRAAAGPAAGLAAGGTDEDTYPAFERMAAELETRIGFLLATIGAAAAPASTREA